MSHKLAQIAAVLSVLLTSCIRTGPPVSPNTLYIAQPDDVMSWDPATAYDSVSLDVLGSIYETLYQYGYLSEDYQPVPLLAADLPKVSKNGLKITIPIRQDIFFQDDPCFTATQGKGRNVKANDFIYSWKRLLDPRIASQGAWILEQRVKGVSEFKKSWSQASVKDSESFYSKPISGLVALDDYTLSIEFNRPYPRFMHLLAIPFSSVVPWEAVKAYGEERGGLAANPVGTGPFRLAQWDRGRRFILRKNPTFHPDFYPTTGADEFREKGWFQDAGKRLPLLEEIQFEVVRESRDRWSQFQKSYFDRILIPKEGMDDAIIDHSNLAPKWVSRGIRLSIDTAPAFYHLSINLRDPLLGKNKLLRQALSSAIDREKWIQLFTKETGLVQTHALPPDLPDRPKNPRLKYGFDLPRAKALLAKAGFPEGKNLPTLQLEMRGNDSSSKKLGDFFVRQFKAVGVKLKYQQNSFSHFLDRIKRGQFQIAYGGWSLDYPDAENVFQLLYGPNATNGPNETGFSHPVFDQLYTQLVGAPSGPARIVLVEKMDELIQEELPWIYGYYVTEYEVSQPWLLNQRATKLVAGRYKYYRVDPEVKARYISTK